MTLATERSNLTALHVLGSGGFHPAHGRHTMCFLLQRSAGNAVLLDAGTGFSRLAEPRIQKVLHDCERLEIVLTHYHLDHVVGLAYLSGLWQRPVRLWAPAPPLVDAEPEQALYRLISPPLFPVALSRFPHPVEIASYAADFSVDGLHVEVRRQQHPGGSVGLRFGEQLAYVTDTAAEPATADFASGVDLLLHEVWCSAAEAQRDPGLVRGHSSADQVLGLARQAGVRRLAPVHHHPNRSALQLEEFLAELNDQAQEPNDPSIEHAIDGQSLDLP